jgi:hypothetical protein
VQLDTGSPLATSDSREGLSVPTTVAHLLSAAATGVPGVVRWGERIPLDEPGIYVVTQTEDVDALTSPRQAQISVPALEELLAARPELRVDGHRPSLSELGERISRFWLPDEPIVYIGLASNSVRSRASAYYRTPLGARRPHAGGWLLKLLADLDELFVHYAAGDPKEAEYALLRQFCTGVSRASRNDLGDPEHPVSVRQPRVAAWDEEAPRHSGARAPKGS